MRSRILTAVIVILAGAQVALFGQEGSEPLNREAKSVLDQFAGCWNVAVTDKPALWSPNGAKRTVRESIGWTLKNRFLIGRDVSQTDSGKSLWLMTYDSKTKCYPLWFFNNKDVLGGEWSNTWDDASKSLVGKASDTPKGWTSRGTNRFPDRNSDLVSVWMKNETGSLLFDSESKKTRDDDDAGRKTIPQWSKLEFQEGPPSPESKILERLVGNWDATFVSKPTEWTPKEVRNTSRVTRKWILDGRVLQDSSEISDGQEGFSLLAYDPRMKAFRSWWFSSEGHTSKATGQWNAATETIAFKSDLENDLKSRGGVRFIDKDRHEWSVIIEDGTGKVHFHGEWAVTRRKQ